MLYVTTRSNSETYTAQYVLTHTRGSDGGLFVPFRLLKMPDDEIRSLMLQPFNQCVASVLNYLFQARVSAWDLEFCIGRYPVRLKTVSHRIVMGECWHNPDWDFMRMIRDISDLIRTDKTKSYEAGGWADIGIRIAVLFGIFGELYRADIADKDKTVDVSVVSGNFFGPLSAWYAREMGLPVGNIICCCNDNGGIWNLFNHGEFRTDTVSIPTTTPEADVTRPDGLECLLFQSCGVSEARRYVDLCHSGRMYCPDDSCIERFSRGMQVSVVSGTRMMRTIPSVYGTNGYLLSPYSALAYAGLLDYRAQTGESRYGLILAEKGPEKDQDVLIDALKITPETLKEALRKM